MDKMSCAMTLQVPKPSDPWLGAMPNEDIEIYVSHVAMRQSIRSIARQRSFHPSTVLRKIRKIEARREDPLFDQAIDDFAKSFFGQNQRNRKGLETLQSLKAKEIPPTAQPSDPEICQVLVRLNEKGALLAVVSDMETAVIVRERDDGNTERLGLAKRSIIQFLSLHGFIETDNPDLKIVRYRLSHQGRAKLRELLNELPLIGILSEPETAQETGQRNYRAMKFESPLMILSRRKEANGERFLSAEIVQAGERLREDFEIACLSGATPAVWQGFQLDPHATDAAGRARHRVALDFEELGPGLTDVAYKTCCQLLGLEKTEQAMGWSARSGKIVLRIALQRLKNHYKMQGTSSPLVG